MVTRPAPHKRHVGVMKDAVRAALTGGKRRLAVTYADAST